MFKKLALLSFALLMSFAFSQEFHTPINLSFAPGLQSVYPQIVFDGSGNGICVWVDGTAQAAHTTDGGANFSSPITLSSYGTMYGVQIAFDPVSGNGVCVWDRNDTIQAAYTTDGGATFSSHIDISTLNQSDYPQIAFDSSGNGVCVWKGSNGVNNLIQAARTIDGGANFSTPIFISLSGGTADSPQIAFDPVSGNGVCVWIKGPINTIQAARTIDHGANFLTPINLSISGLDAGSPQIAFDSSGSGVCVWTRSNGTNYIIQAAQTTDGGANFSTPIDLSIAGQNAFLPQIAFDPLSGNGICVWKRSNGTNVIIQAARTTNGGASFSTPIDLSIAGRDADSPQIAFDPISGYGMCVWSRYDGANTIIQAAQTTDGGVTFSTPVDVSIAGGNAVYPQIAFDGSGNEVAVWQRSEGGNYIIQAASAAEGQSPVTFSVSGSQFKTSSLFQTDIANKLSWNTISSATSYKVYNSNNALLFQGLEPFYFEHGMKQGRTYQYFVTWINNLGVESARTAVSIP